MRCSFIDSWDNWLELIPDEDKDVYFSEAYVRLYERDNAKAVCVLCEENGKFMLIPFIRSTIKGFYDFETAYGYGGPISNSKDPTWIISAFFSIYSFLKKENYVCGLMRFHPLLANQIITKDKYESSYSENEVYNSSIEVFFDRHTAFIDTSKSNEDIWNNQISSKNRNMIRKAEKNGLVYSAEYDFASIEEFIALYKETMKRLEAEDFYFFDNEYFYKLRDSLKGKSFLGTVRKDGILVCSAIFLFSEYYGHYHLQGNDRTYSSLGASNYLLWKTACEMHGLGIRAFHLGGGTSSIEDDTLYKFKKSFCREVKDYYVGKEVFNKHIYLSLCDEWKRENPSLVSKYGKYLLQYRYIK